MKFVFIVGTRPEIIKMDPVIRELKNRELVHEVWLTGQHTSLATQTLDALNALVDVTIAIERTGETVSHLMNDVLAALVPALNAESEPVTVVVQGDTTTGLGAAMAARFLGYEVVHIEAGLRTGVLTAPFPEEANRRIISTIASLHFAPTHEAGENLFRENVPADTVHVVGNTGIDTLLSEIQTKPKVLPVPNRVVVTAHRRENWGSGIANIAEAIRRCAAMSPELSFLVYSHANPDVRSQWDRELGLEKAVSIMDPVGYPEMVNVIRSAAVVLSDSGGIQEECVTLSVPIGVLRSETERPEVLQFPENGMVGTDVAAIVDFVQRSSLDMFEDRQIRSVYGSGDAAHRIAEILFEWSVPR